MNRLIAVLPAVMSLALLINGTLLTTGCAEKTAGHVETEKESGGTDFSAADLRHITDKMIGDMLEFPPILQVTAQRQPIVLTYKIDNKTDRKTDAEALAKVIQSALAESGKFGFLDPAAIGLAQTQLDQVMGADKLTLDPKMAVRLGERIGAEYLLYGDISRVSKQPGSNRAAHYQLTLKLAHLPSGITEWQSAQAITLSKP